MTDFIIAAFTCRTLDNQCGFEEDNLMLAENRTPSPQLWTRNTDHSVVTYDEHYTTRRLNYFKIYEVNNNTKRNNTINVLPLLLL
jgi:hypothetical protein